MTDFSLLVASYNSTLPTLDDGQFHGLQVDVNGRLLVQADVTVLVDFLGLNGAANNANILIIGTEDGTDTGTAHAVRLASDGAVMINDNGGSITVDATNLDIRDLAFATDSVNVSGSTVELGATTLAALESITVVATDLDIRNLTFATDSVDVSNSTNVAVVDGGGSLTVDGVDFDIRDLAFATDSVDVSGSTVELGATTLAALESITVTATNLDIRDLAFATDKVDVSGSEVSLDATTLAALENITVSATDLDIRDLSHTQDSVKVGDGTDFMSVNTDGSINVVSAPVGVNEEYVATDALAAGADGLITITAAATPWVTTASFSHTSGTAYIFGYEWTCDQNAQARLVTDNGTDIIVYKQSLNSSAMPTMVSHFAEGGRIEIAGSAGLAIKLQVKKRSTPGGDALAHSSIHIRK